MTKPLRLDGGLNDALYTSVPSKSVSVQVAPGTGAPATEKTKVWVGFDDENFYIGFAMLGQRPDRRVSTEIRRDVGNYINGNDIVNVFLDPFYNRRNGLSFTLNAIGARNDGQQDRPAVQRGLESDLGSRGRHVRGRMDGGDGAAVPVAPLSAGPRADLGPQRDANRALEERAVGDDAGAAGARQQQCRSTRRWPRPWSASRRPPRARNLDIKPYAVSTLTSKSTTATPMSTTSTAMPGST